MKHPIIFFSAVVLILALGGCGFAPTAAGGFAGPLILSGDAASAAPQAVEASVTAATGNPALGLLAGGAVTTVLGVLGWARERAKAKAAEALRVGERSGWDEAKLESRLASGPAWPGPA